MKTTAQSARKSRIGVLAPEYRALTIGMVALITLVAFESLAVTTAMPTVAQALDGLSWYALAFGGPLASGVVAMVVSGSWCDSRGPARPLWHGTAWFLSGLVVAGLAPTMGVLVAGRVIQGFGAGLLTVALYVVVGQLYPARLRPRIFAAFASGWVVPSLVGPAIAGLIVQHTSWRVVFLAVPALAIPAALVMRPGLARVGTPDRQFEQKSLWDQRARWAIAVALGVGFLHYGGSNVVWCRWSCSSSAWRVSSALPRGCSRRARSRLFPAFLR
jgi:MFS family permease